MRKHEYFALFEFVRFEFLSILNIQSFVIFARNFIDEINVSIWDKICERLVLPVKPEICDIEFDSNASLKGIISFLTVQTGGNVHTRGIVKVTSKSIKGEFVPEHIANLTDDSEYHSLNTPDQWVCYDFQNMKLCPTGYSIRSWGNQRRDKSVEIQNWVVEVSNDGESWIEIDQHENERMETAGMIRSHSVSCSESYQLIRLRQHGRGGIADWLVLVAFELFGTLFPNDRHTRITHMK
jgi:hypothetical protein